MYDKRKTYYLTIDTETANSLEEPMMYDLGGAIHDRQEIGRASCRERVSLAV